MTSWSSEMDDLPHHHHWEVTGELQQRLYFSDSCNRRSYMTQFWCMKCRWKSHFPLSRPAHKNLPSHMPLSTSAGCWRVRTLESRMLKTVEPLSAWSPKDSVTHTLLMIHINVLLKIVLFFTCIKMNLGYDKL